MKNDMKDSLISFFKKESAVGVLLIIATILAMFMANSPFAAAYEKMTKHRVLPQNYKN